MLGGGCRWQHESRCRLGMFAATCVLLIAVAEAAQSGVRHHKAKAGRLQQQKAVWGVAPGFEVPIFNVHGEEEEQPPQHKPPPATPWGGEAKPEVRHSPQGPTGGDAAVRSVMNASKAARTSDDHPPATLLASNKTGSASREEAAPRESRNGPLFGGEAQRGMLAVAAEEADNQGGLSTAAAASASGRRELASAARAPRLAGEPRRESSRQSKALPVSLLQTAAFDSRQWADRSRGSGAAFKKVAETAEVVETEQDADSENDAIDRAMDTLEAASERVEAAVADAWKSLRRGLSDAAERPSSGQEHPASSYGRGMKLADKLYAADSAMWYYTDYDDSDRSYLYY
eukprot:TRINITY_DN57610_c0_g1_i1.p1 TRINITY_DN57610_c0_g1~~TRINITY_DN57610_c0_g1_i1.p1  ORF type:complete len:344 (-),score=88.72 TRINITY_DN57610_c0_g1_i1:110-1141(-)